MPSFLFKALGQRWCPTAFLCSSCIIFCCCNISSLGVCWSPKMTWSYCHLCLRQHIVEESILNALLLFKAFYAIAHCLWRKKIIVHLLSLRIHKYNIDFDLQTCNCRTISNCLFTCSFLFCQCDTCHGHINVH